MAAPRESFTPDASNTALYRRVLDRVYLDIRAGTDPILERAYPIFHP
jgi:hypothetical protein